MEAQLRHPSHLKDLFQVLLLLLLLLAVAVLQPSGQHRPVVQPARGLLPHLVLRCSDRPAAVEHPHRADRLCLVRHHQHQSPPPLQEGLVLVQHLLLLLLSPLAAPRNSNNHLRSERLPSRQELPPRDSGQPNSVLRHRPGVLLRPATHRQVFRRLVRPWHSVVSLRHPRRLPLAMVRSVSGNLLTEGLVPPLGSVPAVPPLELEAHQVVGSTSVRPVQRRPEDAVSCGQSALLVAADRKTTDGLDPNMNIGSTRQEISPSLHIHP